jgi:hypothetical protein
VAHKLSFRPPFRPDNYNHYPEHAEKLTIVIAIERAIPREATMNKVRLSVAVILSLMVVPAYNTLLVLAAFQAQPRQTPEEGKGCAAPKSWGELKSISDRAIAFEDSSGTIRVLDTGPCMRGETKLVVKIVRQ